MRNRFSPKRRLALGAMFVLAAAAVFGGPAASAAPSGAISTTDNTAYTAACLNGQGTNCNIYQNKVDVWSSGLPIQAALGDGTYFFAVLEPGGQGGNDNPNDGTPKNLSDAANGDWTTREFSVANGVITPAASFTHFWDSDNNKIQMFPYDDTSNPGGVYILAVCAVPDTISGTNAPGVNPSDCKYDAFKVKESETETASGPTITKDAEGTNDVTYTWTIQKCLHDFSTADNCVKTHTFRQAGGTVTVKYDVVVGHDGGAIGNVKVTGSIQVFNGEVDSQNNVVPLDITGVTDQLSDGTVCTVTGGALTLTTFETDFTYSCDLGDSLPTGALDNTATVAWDAQDLANGKHLDAGSNNFTFESISFTQTAKDDCTDVTDSFNGADPATALGRVCVGDANPTTFNESQTISVTPGCHDYPNTASESTSGGSDTDTVTVCGPLQTSALTIGFWKNTNGQNLIGTYCAPSGKTSLASYLSTLGGATGPFADAAGKTCSQLKTYVTTVLKGATATNMNVMLRAQMLGTALDVYFSDPTMGYTSTTLNKIKPPSSFLTHGALGGVNIDTTAICPMIDNATAGTANCKNGNPSTDGFASGAFPSACMTVQGILTYESTVPSPFNGSTSTPIWYTGNRTKQEIAKNTFDQINNLDAFGC